jgi:ACT domain-containing protein
MEQPGTDLTKKEIMQDRFIEAYRASLFNISQACTVVGIGRSTYYRWRDSDEDFEEKLDAVKEEKIDFAESALFEKIKKGDTISIIFFLKTIGKSRGYIENSTINVKSAISQMSEERRQAAIDAAMMELPPIRVIQIENNTGDPEDME